MSENTSAQVEVLTAEVRALMVGKRQVTLSVYRQLDLVPSDQCNPFGRVRDSQDVHYLASQPRVYAVGQHCSTGALVRSYRTRPNPKTNPQVNDLSIFSEETAVELKRRIDEYEQNLCDFNEWATLPLIVLAGLR